MILGQWCPAVWVCRWQKAYWSLSSCDWHEHGDPGLCTKTAYNLYLSKRYVWPIWSYPEIPNFQESCLERPGSVFSENAKYHPKFVLAGFWHPSLWGPSPLPMARWTPVRRNADSPLPYTPPVDVEWRITHDSKTDFIVGLLFWVVSTPRIFRIQIVILMRTACAALIY